MTALEQESLRPEDAADWDEIDQVHNLAFGRPDEGRIVRALRACGAARFGVVAERLGRLAGHVLLSEIRIEREGGARAALSLAPLAVRPEFQRLGIGAALVGRALDAARAAGWGSVFVLGNPAYYGRFGFAAELARGFECAYACPAFQAIELSPGALSPRSGRIVYPPPLRAG